jgi:hypothetical protein
MCRGLGLEGQKAQENIAERDVLAIKHVLLFAW